MGSRILASWLSGFGFGEDKTGSSGGEKKELVGVYDMVCLIPTYKHDI